ncbi:hypothetical protein OR16_12845 [Cupriavidus basilensis OR16]|uniref:Transmembrane protein n=1 Tax=Cupriavidus basilensis OR16 TaxID=1127483 RepID=H1S485_9BURK|nr:DUF6622 family protein [Cupriavidus basilensis]EHP42724.1 hypothetical protein OR16_12845 [Cupriavidus basilensis OR16]
MLTGILHHTPLWVWTLLAGLIALGLAQTVPRRMAPARATGVPIAMAVVSLGGVVSVFSPQPLALLGWGIGVAVALALANAIGAWQGIRWLEADRSLMVPGSWVPLALILCLFVTRFAVSVALAVSPGVLWHGSVAMPIGFIYGAVSGIFLSRSLVTWSLTRQALPGSVPG